MKHRIMQMAPISVLLACTLAYAGDLSCYKDQSTDAMQCFDGKNIREKDGIRSTTLYTGGPNGVRKTSFTLHTNCRTGVTHLKDRDGVSFAGGNGDETRAIRALRAGICEGKPRK